MYNSNSPYIPYNEAVVSQALMTVSLVVDQGDEPIEGLSIETHQVLLLILRAIASSCHNYPYTNMSRWFLAVKPTSTIGQVNLEIVTVCYGNTQGALAEKVVPILVSSPLAHEVKAIIDDLAMSCCQALNRTLPVNARWVD